MRFKLHLSLVIAAMALVSFCMRPAVSQSAFVETLYYAGLKAYDKGDYREALRIFKQCVEMGKTIPHKPIKEMYVLFSLAEALRATGQYQESEEAFKKCMAIADKLPARLQPYVKIYNCMGLLYLAQGRFPESEALFKQSISAAPRMSEEAIYAVGNLGLLYFLWGKLDDEAQCVDTLRMLAKLHPQLATPYWQFDSAQLDEQKGNFAQSHEEYATSLKACGELFGPTHPYCGVILTGWAELYRKQSKFDEAQSNLNKALQIYEARYPSEHPDISETKIRLAEVLSEQGKYSKAKALAQEALKSEESVFGTSDSIFVAHARNCLGNIYRQEGHYSEAREALQGALASKKRMLGEDTVETAKTMRDLAMVDADEANFTEAENLLKKSLNIIESQTGPDHPDRPAGANALAHVFLREQKYSDAEPLLLKANQLAERVLGADNAVSASGARDLSELYVKQQQFDKAQQFMEKSLTIDEKLFGKESTQVAADLLSLATIYGAENKQDQAEQLLRRAAQIKNVLPGGSPPEPTISVVTGPGIDRPIHDKWAVVIGISSFKDPSIDLRFAAKDATDFKNFLVNTQKFRADHVKLLTDENATRDNILGILGDKWLASHVKPDDMVVVFISSHGSSADSQTGGTNFLIAYDTNKYSLAATGIPMQWLTKIISEQVRSDRVILVLDVCHSGAVAQGQKDLTRKAGFDTNRVAFGRGQMIICSSLSDQFSWESRTYENSVFTRRLMESLTSNNNNNEMPLSSAFKRLRVLVESEVLRDRGELQTPQMITKYWLGKDPILSTGTQANP